MSARYLSTLDVAKLTLTFSVGATGSVTATSAGGGASAGIDYAFQMGSAFGSGSQSITATVPPSPPTGEWGTITRTVDIFRSVLADGTTGFAGLTFVMSGGAHALVTNGGVDPATENLADANFGSTLVWGGVQELHAFDSAGNEVTLGDDADFTLLGELSGNDWMNPSVELVTAVPEPASGALVAIGLIAFAMIRRRRR